MGLMYAYLRTSSAGVVFGFFAGYLNRIVAEPDVYNGYQHYKTERLWVPEPEPMRHWVCPLTVSLGGTILTIETLYAMRYLLLEQNSDIAYVQLAQLEPLT